MKRQDLLTLTALLSIACFTTGHAATLTWTNGGSGANINVADNWSPAQAPANSDDLIFANESLGNPTWNNGSGSFRPNIQLTDGGWNFNVTGRIYSSIDYSTAGLGVTTFTTTSGGRVGTQQTSTWNIGTGNILVITGAGRTEFNQPLTKTGSGMVVIDLPTANGSRGMTINAGTVLINNTAPQASNTPWSVAAGATLGGTGTVRSTTGTTADGTIAPGGDGTYGALIETLDFNDDLTMGAGSTLAIDFGVANESDTLVMTDSSTFDLSAANNILDISGALTPIVGSYTIVDGLNSGSFEDILYNGSSVFSDPDFSIDYNSNSIVVNVIPEPASLMLLGMGGALMLSRRRK